MMPRGAGSVIGRKRLFSDCSWKRPWPRIWVRKKAMMMTPSVAHTTTRTTRRR